MPFSMHSGWIMLGALLLILGFIMKPLGIYMAAVYEGRPTLLSSVLHPIEHFIYHFCGISQNTEMTWKAYWWSGCLIQAWACGLCMFILWMGTPLPWHGAFNLAISFVTNTNWQGAQDGATYSHWVMNMGLGAQQFISAATAMAWLVGIIRGLRQTSSNTLGSFWVDLTRSVLYILLPLGVVLALCLCSQGVIQTWGDSPLVIGMLDAQVTDTQTIPQGSVASFVSMKILGGNGGGYFSANGAHPFENPTPLSFFIQFE